MSHVNHTQCHRPQECKLNNLELTLIKSCSTGILETHSHTHTVPQESTYIIKFTDYRTTIDGRPKPLQHLRSDAKAGNYIFSGCATSCSVRGGLPSSQQELRQQNTTTVPNSTGVPATSSHSRMATDQPKRECLLLQYR